MTSGLIYQVKELGIVKVTTRLSYTLGRDNESSFYSLSYFCFLMVF